MPSLFASYLRVYEPLTAFDRGPAGVLAPLRAGGAGGGAGRGPGPAADRGARGAGRGLDPAARPARRGVRPGGRRDAAGLPVEPADPGGRGGAERAGRRAAGARRRVRAAGAGRAGPGRGRGLAQRRPGAGARRAPGARADRHLGRAAALVRLVDPEERELSLEPGRRVLRYRTEISKARRRAHAGAVGAAQVGRGRADHRGGRGERAVAGGVPPPVGGGAGLRRPGRPAVRTRRWPRTTRRRWSRRGWPGCPGATPRRPPRRTRQLVARWRAVQLLERCN